MPYSYQQDYKAHREDTLPMKNFVVFESFVVKTLVVSQIDATIRGDMGIDEEK